jgi:hypothetical protein
MSQYESIGIQLDEIIHGTQRIFWTAINAAVSSTTITLREALPGAAASGNTVYFSNVSFEAGTTTY